MTTETLDVTAKRAVMHQYATAHERLAEREQLLVHHGCVHSATTLHELAVRVLRAYVAEADDPEVRG